MLAVAQVSGGLSSGWLLPGAAQGSVFPFSLPENTRQQHVRLYFNISIVGEFKAKSKTTSLAPAAPRLIAAFFDTSNSFG